MRGLALCRGLLTLGRGRRGGLAIVAVGLAASLPAVAGASMSSASPLTDEPVIDLLSSLPADQPVAVGVEPRTGLQLASEPGIGVSPNPTPYDGLVSFSWSASSYCWDNMQPPHEAFGNNNFQMRVTTPFWWTVWCESGGSQSVYVDVLPPPAPSPVGYFDQIDSNGVATGWTCDGDNFGAALQVQFYSDGPMGTGNAAGSTTANIQREAGVAANCGGNPYHGFSFSIPPSLRNGQTHTLYAYGMNIGGGNNTHLGNSPRSFLLYTPPQLVVAPLVTPAGPVTPGTVLSTTTGNWSPHGPEFSYEWLRDGQPISGAQSQTYSVVAADFGKNIRSRVTSCAPYPCNTAQSSNQVYVAANPVGHFDQVDANGVATGWACDQDNYSQPLEIRFFSGGPMGSGVPAGTTIANVTREPAVAANCGGVAAHGFSFQLPLWLRDGNQHTVYAHAMNVGGGSDKHLGGSPKTILLFAPPASVTPPFITAPNPAHPGAVLTTSDGAWSPPGEDFEYQWLRNGSPIPDADGPAYTVTAGDVDATIKSRVKACAPVPCSEFVESSNSVIPSPPEVPPLEQTFGTREGGAGVHGISGSDYLMGGVNSRSGAFTTHVADVALPGDGEAFSWERAYTSADTTVGRMGPGWTDSYSASLAINGSTVTLHGEDGQRILYTSSGGGSYDEPPGARSTLSAVLGGYELTRQDQTVYRFNPSGRLMAMEDRHGLGVVLVYDGQGRLATITDAAGRQATISYNAQNLVSQVQSHDGRTVSYGYTAGRLASVTDVRGKVWSYTYDGAGRLASIVDPLNHAQVNNVYGTDGRVESQTDALGNPTTYGWDAGTGIATATDANGHPWKHDYDNSLLARQINPLGNVSTLAHDPADLNLDSVTNPLSQTTTMTYEGGNLTRLVPPLVGLAMDFSYNARNDVDRTTDSTGTRQDFAYDAAGSLTEVTHYPAGAPDPVRLATYTYDTDGRVLTYTDANENTTTYTYFPATGYLQSSTDPLGNKTTYAYDAAGRVATRVDPKGNVTGCGCAAQHTWSYTYDATGNQLTETNPLGQTTTNVYDDAGRLTSTRDALGRTTAYAYDAANRQISETAPDPDGTGSLLAPVTNYTYDGVGNKLTETDPRQNTTSFEYDAADRLVRSIGPDPDGTGQQTAPVTTTTYDANGNVISTVEPRGHVAGANPDDYKTTFTYDAAGRQLKTTLPDPDGPGPQIAPVTENAYDEVGNLASVKDANGRFTHYTHDAAGRVLTVLAPDLGLTTYTYDDAGNVVTRTDARNNTTAFAHDDVGRLVTETSPDPDGPGPQGPAVTTLAYDPNGNLLTKTDPNGNATTTAGDGVTTYGYDRANRKTSVNYSDTTPDVTFTYDAVGNRLTTMDGSGTETRVYDNLDRVQSVARGSNTFSYVYDAASNITRRTYPGGTNTDYTYDKLNRLTTVVSNSQTTSYAYDVASNLMQTTLPSGNGYVETNVYDRAGRVTEVKNQKGSTILSRFVSTLDAVGNPTQIVRTGGLTQTQAYTYDANDRITSVCFQAGTCPGASDPFIRWTYDKVGNRLTEQRPGTATTNYTYDARDRLLSAGPTAFAYDQNGNQTQKGTRTFTYDLENRLRTTTQGSTTTTYSYDGDGKRLQASTGSSSSQKTNLLWDTSFELPLLARETNGSGSQLRRYVYGFRRISMTDSSNTTYYHYDPLGSVANMTSSSGSTRWTYSYEPFGSIRTETSNSGPTNLMKFTGEYLDPTALYHLRARQYDSASGRLLSMDPARQSPNSTAVSSYVYALDRPTVMVDPSGEIALFGGDPGTSPWTHQYMVGRCFASHGTGCAHETHNAGLREALTIGLAVVGAGSGLAVARPLIGLAVLRGVSAAAALTQAASRARPITEVAWKQTIRALRLAAQKAWAAGKWIYYTAKIWGPPILVKVASDVEGFVDCLQDSYDVVRKKTRKALDAAVLRCAQWLLKVRADS